MRSSSLNSTAYTSDDILRTEMDVIFRRRWIFAGLASTLKTRNAFFTRKIGGVSIVFTTPDGQTVKAYENACAHRQMPIQVEEFGNRSLVCPYHAWSYTCETGQLKGVANPSLYGMRRSEKETIRLREFNVTVIGALIFINLSENPVPIEDQFRPEYIEQIREVSGYFDKTYAHTSFYVNYNWKLNFENVMDYNHVPFVHPESFGAIMKSGVEANADGSFADEVKWDQVGERIVDLTELSYSGIGDIKMGSRWYSHLIRRYGNRDAYYNWFIFPNVNMCSVRGEHFLIQQYMPVSASRTRYHLWVMSAERLSLRTDFTALLRGLILSEKAVIDEDIVFLEALQDSLNSSSAPALHGQYEHMLYRFGDWYEANVLNPGSST